MDIWKDIIADTMSAEINRGKIKTYAALYKINGVLCKTPYFTSKYYLTKYGEIISEQISSAKYYMEWVE